MTMRYLLRRTLILIAAAGTLTGCVIPMLTPVYDTGYRQSVPEQMPDFIHEGVTTRDDVLLGLGKPHARGAGDSWFVYGSTDIQGGVAFLVGWLLLALAAWK